VEVAVGFKIASERAGHWQRPIRAVGSTAQTGFPASNILDPSHPYQQARATANTSGTTYFAADFGAAFTPAAIIVGGLTVASIKIQGSADNSTWPASGRDSGALTVPQDPLTGRYNYVYQPSGWTTNTRYIRAVSNTSDTVDGSGVFGCAYILALGTFPELTAPLADPVDLAPIEPAMAGDGIGGADHSIAVGEIRAEITIAQSLFASAQESEVLTLLRREGEVGRMAFWLNDGDASQVDIVRRRGRSSVTITGPNSRRVGGISLREQV
jgi:hypothetical protein